MSNIVNAAASGDLRKSLEALRDSLAADIDSAEPRDKAALAKQLRDTLIAIDKLPGGQVKTELDRIAESIPADELAQRRARRQPGAAS